MPKRELLSLEEYVTIARVCASLGVEKVRLTGGEPTLYPHLGDLISAIGALPFRDIAMTSNGSLLQHDTLRRWVAGGLNRITFSLDSLRPDRVRRITRSQSSPETVINAIAMARDAGLAPIKVNAVVMRDINDDEMADFADFAREQDIDMRLIEFMPLDSSRVWKRGDVVGAQEILAAIRARHELVAVGPEDPSSTSLNFRFADGAPGQIGVIAPVTRPFCGACSRLRVTADGKVRPCLFSHEEWDMRPLLRGGADDNVIESFLVDSLWTKQAGHRINADDFVQPERTMSAIGG